MWQALSIRSLLVPLVSIFLLGSCIDASFKSTKSGLKYRMVIDKDGESFENGKFVLLNVAYSDENDSLLFSSSTRGMPLALLYIDTVWDRKGQLYEGLNMMTVGDSAIFKVKCQNLYEISFQANVPYGLDPFSEITVYAGVKRSLTKQEFNLFTAQMIQLRKAEEKKMIEQQLFEDMGIIDMHLQDKGIVPMELESGVRYEVIKDKDGRVPEFGDSLYIYYTAKLLDETVIEKYDRGSQPFGFQMGSDKVVKGLNEGVALMSVGDIYNFYIPSPLGFGRQSYKNIVTPYSILVYEVELIEIKEYER